jgi:succinate-acetate transporter protein
LNKEFQADLGNAGAVGLVGFAATTFVLSVINTGLVSNGTASVIRSSISVCNIALGII